MNTNHITIDKRASVTTNLQFNKHVEITGQMDPSIGNVCVVRALEEKKVYDKIELVTGRMAKVSRGDIIAGALGRRSALQGFVGTVPSTIAPHDTLHILNLGGVLGIAQSFNPAYGAPLQVEVLGMVVKNDTILNTHDTALPLNDHFEGDIPLIVVAGTTMNSGKTIVAARIIRELSWKGYRVCAAKVSGIAALKDIFTMEDHGAVKALSFLDFGYPSTVATNNISQIAKSAYNRLLSYNPDVIVMELGDGLFGEYGVFGFYEDNEVRTHIGCNVICATDQVGTRGAYEALRRIGVSINIISGPVTDNLVGTKWITKNLLIPALNSLNQSEELATAIEPLLL